MINTDSVKVGDSRSRLRLFMMPFGSLRTDISNSQLNRPVGWLLVMVSLFPVARLDFWGPKLDRGSRQREQVVYATNHEISRFFISVGTA